MGENFSVQLVHLDMLAIYSQFRIYHIRTECPDEHLAIRGSKVMSAGGICMPIFVSTAACIAKTSAFDVLLASSIILGNLKSKKV